MTRVSRGRTHFLVNNCLACWTFCWRRLLCLIYNKVLKTKSNYIWDLIIRHFLLPDLCIYSQIRLLRHIRIKTSVLISELGIIQSIVLPVFDRFICSFLRMGQWGKWCNCEKWQESWLVHETSQAETRDETETSTSKTETRPRRFRIWSRRDRDETS